MGAVSGSTGANVLVVSDDAAYVAERLAARFPAVRFRATNVFPDDEELAEVDVLMTKGADATSLITGELIAKMPRLSFVQAMVSGSDLFQAALADRPGVLLARCRGVHGPQVSEMALLHMLALSRQVRRIVRNQDDLLYDRPEQRMLCGRCVGIVGLGVIGSRLARICRALGMTVYGLSRTTREVEGVDRLFLVDQLLEFAAEVDFLVLVVPHTSETDKMIDARVFAAMKPTAVLVNVARAAVVDEDALREALERGQIAGAGIDVWPEWDSPSPLWKLDNVFATPHLAGDHVGYGDQILGILATNLGAYLAGTPERMEHVVRLEGVAA
jgi:D-2-hydroxyacid dehydrogenase (NADP+)